MHDLDRALLEIRDIRRQVARSSEFRGYGPLTLLVTAVLAMAAGWLQRLWVPAPAAHPAQYIALWLGLGIVCAALIASQMLTRARRLHSEMADEMIRGAVLQFLPAALAGVLLPFVLLRGGPGVFWLLPGLWQILFSLGVFASCRSLPRPMLLVGAWFLMTGLACVGAGAERALSPVTMAGAYAVGMVSVALIHRLCAKEAAV